MTRRYGTTSLKGDMLKGRPGCCAHDDMGWLIWQGGKRRLRRRYRRRNKQQFNRELTHSAD